MRTLQGGNDLNSVTIQAQLLKLEQQKMRNQQLELMERTRSQFRKKIETLAKQKCARSAVVDIDMANKKIGYKFYTWQMVGPEWRSGHIVLNRYDQPEYTSPWIKLISNLIYCDDLYKLPVIGYYDHLKLEVPIIQQKGEENSKQGTSVGPQNLLDDDLVETLLMRFSEDVSIDRKVLKIEWQANNPRIEEIIYRFEAVNQEDSESVSDRSNIGEKKIKIPVLEVDPEAEANKSTLRLPSSTERGMVISGDERFTVVKKGFSIHLEKPDAIGHNASSQSASNYITEFIYEEDHVEENYGSFAIPDYQAKLEQRRELRRDTLNLPKLNLKSVGVIHSAETKEQTASIDQEPKGIAQISVLEQELAKFEKNVIWEEEDSMMNHPSSSLNSGHHLSALLVALPDSVYDTKH